MMKIYFIAGENSGDFIGSKIISSLKGRLDQKKLEINGIGGPLMIKEGLDSLIDINEINLMGFFEIIPSILRIRRLIEKSANDIIEKSPDLLITIDSPAFTKRVAKLVKKRAPHIKLLHVVAPSVWAYRPKRAKQFAQIFDHLFTLLHFELPYFKKEGLDAIFIGHPIFQQKFFAKSQEISGQLKDDISQKLICITPGSRLGELKKHMPTIVEALNILSNKYDLKAIFVQPSDASKNINLINSYLRDVKFAHIVTEDRLNAFAAADVALAKSGTNTLEIAASGTPMIVGYKINFLSYWLIKSLIKIRFISLINIIEDDEIIPELIQNDFTADKIAEHLELFLSDSNHAKDQVEMIDKIIRKMGFAKKDSPSEIAASKIIELLN